MEKKKRWQLATILITIVLTIFNILPTVFYYTKPLKSPVDEKIGKEVALSAAKRINQLEKDAILWIKSFCDLLHITPSSIELDKEHTSHIHIQFSSSSDAQIFSSYLPRAGALIPFAPSALSMTKQSDPSLKKVTVQRQIPIHLDEERLDQYFQYSTKYDTDENISPLYLALVHDRLTAILASVGSNSETGNIAASLVASTDAATSEDLLMQLAQNIESYKRAFGENSAPTKRFYSSFFQLSGQPRAETFNLVLAKLENTMQDLALKKKEIVSQAEPSAQSLEQADILAAKYSSLALFTSTLKKHQSNFTSGPEGWSLTSAASYVAKNCKKSPMMSTVETISLESKNPVIDKIIIDWSNETITFSLFNDIEEAKAKAEGLSQLENIDLALYSSIASVMQRSGEEIRPKNGLFEISLTSLPSSKSFLAFRLAPLAKGQSEAVLTHLLGWRPLSPELDKENFPVLDYDAFSQQKKENQKLCLMVFAPALHPKITNSSLKMDSIYVIAKGLTRLIKKYEESPNSPQAKDFFRDIATLRSHLYSAGFTGYMGSSLPSGSEFKDDFIFEAPAYFLTTLMASRENFTVHGSKRFGVLEFSDVEQRILTQNKIDTAIHQDLLRARDDYNSAQVSRNGASRFDFPKPAKSPLLSNLSLSMKKYFRGDDRKILHWGLDLSGGKTVQIELRDSANKPVTDEVEIRQGINELYSRVNKMGVSEVSIRQEGDHITLDFPGAQGLSAAELVKASSMYFHVVNEKFSPSNKSLAEITDRFLQQVWNEAVVTGKKSAEEINSIAYKHLYGDVGTSENLTFKSDAAKILYDNGLRIALDSDAQTSSEFSQTYSKIALYRGADYTDWHGQTHPLIFIFHNFALEGSNLIDVHASYDPNKGNFLSFGVRGSYKNHQGKDVSARDDFSAWTTPFCKEKLSISSLGAFNQGRGWRMAVVLNGTVISAPTLDSPLRESAMISGNFSQREIRQLEADLKAGSLSYTPRILSEQNVSPELGAKERSSGIIATGLALLLVIAAMITYYRFGGLIASIAVVFNLLIMWATLQNIQATLTLPMIAGLILTVGMAVDANVLVFERIREEFSHTGRIKAAIHAGYEKAFSAIIDSNVTTIIAGLVLLNFDSGPIKGFALTLIIGIASSMLTALFMTRYFFSRWVEGEGNKKLTMMSLFQGVKFNFLAKSKGALCASAVVIVAGAFAFTSQWSSVIGMDFTGGYALSVALEPNSIENYKERAERGFIAAGIAKRDVQIRELSPNNHLRIFLSKNLEQPGHPFHLMPIAKLASIEQYSGENPRVEWIINILHKQGLTLTKKSQENIDASFSQISGQMSDAMRNSAIIGLVIALAGILIYITIRFEFKYAISATICLCHDLLFTLAAIALLHACGVAIQLDLNIIAALMTIIGYSLNDTIIIFDRIREDVRLCKGLRFEEIINRSLNVTLGRTLMTSGTTLLVLIPLIALGGTTVFGFSLVMAIGVVFGTLSSLFIAAPLMLFFHTRETNKKGVYLQSHAGE